MLVDDANLKIFDFSFRILILVLGVDFQIDFLECFLFVFSFHLLSHFHLYHSNF